VGTRSITDSEILSKELTRIGIDHTVLHALHHEEEAEIISQAGKLSSVIVATNIAGRGTDISLSEASIKLGGLHVIATERHESKRVDMQLFGRSARQGQEGSVQAILSLEDEIIIQKCPKLLAKYLSKIVHTSVGKKISIMVYITIQSITDKKASKMRRDILANDFSMSSRLSFSGK
jgi:preprotein translocase subunit SecA